MIGGCHEAQGELHQALEAYAQAGAVRQAAFGEDSVQCASVNSQSARVHIKKFELDCAMQLLQGALRVFEVPLPYPATHCWLCLTTIGLCRRQWVSNLTYFSGLLSASQSCTRRRASWMMRSTGCQRCSLWHLHPAQRAQMVRCRLQLSLI